MGIDWVIGRMREPSTYAAIGVGVLGVGVLLDSFWIVIAGIAVGVAAFVLKEKGVY
jgi:hypothetical protein|tara:strand:+ start:448 stop:615 length:168 start_codon:yes stop_codon:yes gene_type:complete